MMSINPGLKDFDDGIKSSTTKKNALARRGDELRRLQYFGLLVNNEGTEQEQHTFVPTPLTSSSRSEEDFAEIQAIKMGIYKSCVGEKRIIKQFPKETLGIRSLQIANDKKVLVIGLRSGGLMSLHLSDCQIIKEYLKQQESAVCPITCIRFNPTTANSNIFYASTASGEVKLFSVAASAAYDDDDDKDDNDDDDDDDDNNDDDDYDEDNDNDGNDDDDVVKEEEEEEEEEEQEGEGEEKDDDDVIDDCKNETIIKEADNEINSIDLNSDGSKIITGGKDAGIRLYDGETFQLVSEYKRENYDDNPEKNTAPFHRLHLFIVKYHPECPNIFVSGGWDSLVKIWDTRNANPCVNTIIGPHISGHAVDVKKYSLLTGSFTPNDGIQLWDLRNAKRLKNFKPRNAVRIYEGHFIYATQFFHGDPREDVILSANVGLKALDICSLQQDMIIHSFQCFRPVSCMHSVDNKVVFGDMGNNLYVCVFKMAGSINEHKIHFF